MRVKCTLHTENEKSAQRDANTARALAVVRLGHRPPARRPAVTNPQTGPITTHNVRSVKTKSSARYITQY